MYAWVDDVVPIKQCALPLPGCHRLDLVVITLSTYKQQLQPCFASKVTDR
jgi:hypothetical protein